MGTGLITKGENFYDCLSAFPITKSFQNECNLKEKNFLLEEPVFFFKY